jgi:hypothetical protein
MYRFWIGPAIAPMARAEVRRTEERMLMKGFKELGEDFFVGKVDVLGISDRLLYLVWNDWAKLDNFFNG